jgi:hypothetical protein
MSLAMQHQPTITSESVRKVGTKNPEDATGNTHEAVYVYEQIEDQSMRRTKPEHSDCTMG